MFFCAALWINIALLSALSSAEEPAVVFNTTLVHGSNTALVHGSNTTLVTKKGKRASQQAPYPDLYILGAKKCATTSLWDLLVKHPDICKSNNKEPFFFSIDENYAQGAGFYRKRFYNPNCHGKYIDGSTNYLAGSQVPKRMNDTFQETRGNKRFVVVLRDPVARAFSWYNHQVKHCLSGMHRYAGNMRVKMGKTGKGKETGTETGTGSGSGRAKGKVKMMHVSKIKSKGNSSKSVGEDGGEDEFGNDLGHDGKGEQKVEAGEYTRRLLRGLSGAGGKGIQWNPKALCSERHCTFLDCHEKATNYTYAKEVDSIASFREYVVGSHFSMQSGDYVDQLLHWMKFFPREQIMVLNFEHLLSDQYNVLRSLESFLGVRHSFNADVKIPMSNTAKDRTFHTVLDCHTHDLLQKYYAPSIERLLTFLNNTDYPKSQFEPDFPKFQKDTVCINL
ncbi:P-loop containing nucleoside triphosphate hydrolase protein [Ochromonadaceae sp. CCMP2298]|nr:P-loop containing nucleoside triphosphate hydrolase protein [Ochromonadaceae sp. CCMP2298]